MGQAVLAPEAPPGATSAAEIAALRTTLAQAAAGERFLLHTGLSADTTATTAHLAAMALAYAGGWPVSTLVEVPAADGDAVTRAQRFAALVRGGPAEQADMIRQASARMLRLALPDRADEAQVAFLRGLARAWAFAVAYGGEPAMVHRALSTSRFLAWPAEQAGRPEFTDAGGRYSVLAPCLLHADRPTVRAADLANPSVVRLWPGITPAELGRLCDLLDPHGEDGRLVLVTGSTGDLGALAAAVAGHRAAWVLGGELTPLSAHRLHAVWAALAAHSARLAGMSVLAGGRRLARVVRLATLLHDESTHNRTRTGAPR